MISRSELVKRQLVFAKLRGALACVVMLIVLNLRIDRIDPIVVAVCIACAGILGLSVSFVIHTRIHARVSDSLEKAQDAWHVGRHDEVLLRLGEIEDALWKARRER